MAIVDILLFCWLIGIARMAYSKFGKTKDKAESNTIFRYSLLFFLINFVVFLIV